MFRGYYYPTPEEFSELWEKGIFIFDANILLNIYRYSDKTRDLFIKILEEVSDRTIIPHQAAQEYQENRLSVINTQKKAFKNLKKYLENENSSINEHLKKYKRHPSINKDQIIKELDTTFKKVIKDLENKSKKHPDLFKNDDLRDELTTLLKGKIWEPFSEEVMQEIWEVGKERYKNKIPPGYEDEKDKEGFKKCGDLVLWYQILDIANKKGSHIILVTDDTKKDWWWEFDGRTIGPRRELVEEIYNETGVLFYMYKTDNFLKYAEKELDIKTDPSVIKEVKDAMSDKQSIYYIHGGWKRKDDSNSPIEIIDVKNDSGENEFEWKLIENKKLHPEEDILFLDKRIDELEEKMAKNKMSLRKKERDLIDLEVLIDKPSSESEFYKLSDEKKFLNNKIRYLKEKIQKYELEYNKLIYKINEIDLKNSNSYEFIKCPKCGYYGTANYIKTLNRVNPLCVCPDCGYAIN